MTVRRRGFFEIFGGDFKLTSRIGVVFAVWKCDKKNQGWREGPDNVRMARKGGDFPASIHLPDPQRIVLSGEVK
jgi:hypothetical protein